MFCAQEPLRGNIYSKTSKLFRLDTTKFNVLNHGDVWINNIQFNDNDLLLVIFPSITEKKKNFYEQCIFLFKLDYQISFYGSPSFDLLYFIINSAIA